MPVPDSGLEKPDGAARAVIPEGGAIVSALVPSRPTMAISEFAGELSVAVATVEEVCVPGFVLVALMAALPESWTTSMKAIVSVFPPEKLTVTVPF